jgi:hypothetical protein
MHQRIYKDPFFVFVFLAGWMDGWWGKHSMGFSSHGRHGRLKAQQKESRRS